MSQTLIGSRYEIHVAHKGADESKAARDYFAVDPGDVEDAEESDDLVGYVGGLDRLDHLLADARGQLGVDHGRHHAGDIDSGLAQLGPHRLADPDDGVLGPRVGGDPREAAFAGTTFFSSSSAQTSGCCPTRSLIGTRRPSVRQTSVSPATHSRRSDITGFLFSRCSTPRFSCDSAITGQLNSFASAFRPREISEISVARFSFVPGTVMSCR